MWKSLVDIMWTWGSGISTKGATPGWTEHRYLEGQVYTNDTLLKEPFETVTPSSATHLCAIVVPMNFSEMLGGMCHPDAR